MQKIDMDKVPLSPREWMRAEINRLAKLAHTRAVEARLARRRAARRKPPPAHVAPPPTQHFLQPPRYEGESRLAYEMRCAIPGCTLPASAFGDPVLQAQAAERFAASYDASPRAEPTPHQQRAESPQFAVRWERDPWA